MVSAMTIGYDGKLYILAFDHRGSFAKRFNIEGDPTPEETERLADGKHLVFEGIEAALEHGVDASSCGALVDEQFDPDFSKVLVRYNPEGDAEMNQRQAERLKRLGDWLHENDRKFLFELLVPAEEAQLASVDGDADRYDAELRPKLMIGAIAELQNAGVEADIWKIEGVDERSDCEAIAAQCRAGGRDGVVCVVLGRGADDAKVDQWLEAAAPVDAYVGFAIGRSIWGSPLDAFVAGDLPREEAAAKIADNYQRFIDVYNSAE